VGSLREARSAITPFHMAGDTVVYALVTTIVDGRRLAGYLVERRRLTASPNAGRQLAELIGERARLAVGNVAGDLWNDFSRPISGVPAAVAAPGPHEYERDGVAVLAQSARIAATPWQILIEFPRDLVFARAQTFLVRVGWITLALLGIGIGGAWAAGRWIARPLRRVTEAAEAIAAGQLTAPLTSGRTDEIGRLNTAFNTMASQVTRSRVRLEAQVEERTAALQETLQELEAFSYTVSHDLRAPLRAMQGFAQALLEDYGRSLDATGHDYATRVVEASRRMDELIQDLLAYGRLSRQELSLGAVDLDGVTTDAIRSVADDAQRRGGAIDVASPLGEVVGNARLLQQVIENLVANAVKFVPPGVAPRVRIASETLNGRRRLWVQDNGIGVAPEHQERIFRVFERLHGGETYPGTGIGLAIVRRAIERMDGHVGVESSPGAGSRFWIELPVGGAR
jgi:signal transduction histidine kinase